MSTPLLLDTCAVLWISDGARIADSAALSLNEAASTDVPICVSPITAWEIGIMVSKNRLNLSAAPLVWFRNFTARGMKLADMPVDVLIAASNLPGNPPNDPSDRIIIATAREYDYAIVTRDREILRCAADGHVRAIAC